MVRYALALAAVSTATLTGCSTTLDADKAETEIAKAVRVQAGVPVKSVECPEDVKAKKGDTILKIVKKYYATDNARIVRAIAKVNKIENI